MPNDFISREALDALLYRKQMEYSADNERPAIIAIQEARLLLQRFPAADVVEVVHGEWISPYPGEPEETCNRCNVRSLWAYGNYCPYCGAKMDGGENHAD